MVNLDVDSDPATFNSSSAGVVAPGPVDRAVRRAVLGGAGHGGRPAASAATATGKADAIPRRRGPTYRTITTQQEFGPTAGDQAYQQFADVTAIVRDAGAGTYWGRTSPPVPARIATRAGRWWSSTGRPDLPLRNLTVFNGFSDVARAAPETIDDLGVPGAVGRAGRRPARAWWPTRATRRPRATAPSCKETRLATARLAGHELLQRRRTTSTAPTSRPAARRRNMLGFDIKSLGAPGVIPTGRRPRRSTREHAATGTSPASSPRRSTSTRRTSRPAARRSINLDGHDPGGPGDTLEFTLTYTNSGQDPAGDAIALDPLPPGTTYVPGSLEVVSGPNDGH